MATLNKKQKIFIVRSLAVFNTPQETVLLVKEEFDLEVSRQQVETYDPTKRAGKDLSAELKDEFELTRKDFLDTPQNIPIANLSVRLQRLENQYQKHGKNRVAALSILKQAAEDVGGKYTNKTELTGAGGGPLQSENITYVTATDEQVRQAIDELENEY
ncbi:MULTISPECIES: DUF2280 domain-containing protein [Acinetobacter]|uniref:DUF2280 domain-containing protein n=1 Tax=Acinetobacter TaxID=469 RepID=UPI000447BBE7|nr:MULTISPECIES: DUF2280 domain-containing protein [Acinetobacter]EXA67159.1 hypothetical protein J504_1145 [Acinetobacter baumannii 348935]MCV2452428.1 DUF2280 domain-containing protein [Acinetobacter johnsonii]QBK69664.1 DUF2280 domain-containing protein [Acinetobacter johnsonii]